MDKTRAIEEEKDKILQQHDGMPVELAVEIAKYNLSLPTKDIFKSITEKDLDEVDRIANKHRLGYEGLRSNKPEKINDALVSIIGRDLTDRVAKNDELSIYLAEYIADVIGFTRNNQ